MITIDEVFDEYPRLYVKTESQKKLDNGNPLDTADFINMNTINSNSKIFRVYFDDMFYALYKYNGNNFKVYKYFR